jgi:hypothetical protein
MQDREKLQQEIREIRAGFIRQGTSLRAFTKKIGRSGGHVHKVLFLERQGEKSMKLRQLIIDASRGNANEFSSHDLGN